MLSLKRIGIFLGFLFFTILAWATPKTGDIIFQKSKSRQSQAIALATHSPFTHMGVILEGERGGLYVFEASSEVTIAPLDSWIKRGENENYIVKRLKDFPEGLGEGEIQALFVEGRKLAGLPYDSSFNWGDSEMYCSELVYKLFQRFLGKEIGQLQELGSFDLSSDLVKGILRERYGNNIPLDETVISPASMVASEELFTVENQWPDSSF